MGRNLIIEEPSHQLKRDNNMFKIILVKNFKDIIKRIYHEGYDKGFTKGYELGFTAKQIKSENSSFINETKVEKEIKKIIKNSNF